MNSKDSKKEIHLSQGTVIRGRYQIVNLIGRGGFCYTYKAFDSVLNVYVAIKEYFPHGVASRQSGNTVTVFTKADENMFYKGMRRFLNEARSLAQFNTNPSVVSIYDFFEENNTAYLIMEYLEGEDMKKHVGPAGNVLDFEYVKWLADYLCDTLAQIHEAGIVHRDISPDNIFICNDGNIKLIDFGAVKQSMNKENESVTVILKQGYAPIEQYSSKGKLGPWTDIYALGATIYRLITGRVPPESVERMVNDLLVPAHMLNPEIPKNFSFALMKAMSLKMEDRYHSMQEFKAGLNDMNSYPDVYYNQVLGDAYKIQPTESWETKALIEESSMLQQGGFQDVSMDEGGYGGAVPEVSGTYGTSVQGGYSQQGGYDDSGALGSGPLGYDDSGALGSGPLGYDDSGASGSGSRGYSGGSGARGYSGGSGARGNGGRAVPEVPGTYGTGRNNLLIPLVAVSSVLVVLICVLVGIAMIPTKKADSSATTEARVTTGSTRETETFWDNNPYMDKEVTTEAESFWDNATSTEQEETTEAAGDEDETDYGPGGVIKVYAFTDEVPSMMDRFLEAHPDFNYQIESTIIATTDGAYQPALDYALNSGGEDMPDIYCAEEAFVTKYTQGEMSSFAAPYEDLGIDVDTEISKADIAPFTVDIGTNPEGKVVGLTYQSTGGAFIYRRSLAREIFGTDDPVEISRLIGGGSQSWDKFFEAAETCKSKGVSMLSGLDDMWVVVRHTADQGWIVDGKLHIDPKREASLDYSKELINNGYINDTLSWNDAWFNDMSDVGPMEGHRPVFGYFGPAWMINYVIAPNCGGERAGEGTFGDWAVCEPPVGFHWGGTWLMANKNSDKKKAIGAIIEWITLDCTENGLQYKWANGTLNGDGGTKDLVASNTVLEMSNGELDFLSGQNMYDVFIPANKYVNGKILTQYDEKINSLWFDEMYQYAHGKSKDAAIADFKADVKSELGIDAE